ncbi:MAG: hypothetical protein K1X83_07970 [Oligoflexia bacterium]|nr:hypothetical protein [Oligoflexia bacterium]
MKHSLICALGLTLMLGLNGCGGDSNGGSADSTVTRIDVETPILNVGQSTVVKTRFSFSANDVFDDGEIVAVVLRLPAGLAFRDSSAELDLVGGPDDPVGALLANCNTGESFLVFNLDANDLVFARNPNGNADAELKLTADALAATQPGSAILARADALAAFQCGLAFDAEASAPVEVR